MLQREARRSGVGDAGGVRGLHGAVHGALLREAPRGAVTARLLRIVAEDTCNKRNAASVHVAVWADGPVRRNQH